MPRPLERDICFISFCICWNWFSSWFSSCTVVPLPLAMRRRREAFRMAGVRRSCGVMERTMASTRWIFFPSRTVGAQLSLEGGGAGKHLQHLRDGAHALHRPQLLQEVLQVEGGPA